MNILFKLDKPIILAHRGASAFAPENTIAAFKLAKDHDADGVELDVKLTKDEIPIIIHDGSFNRTTNGSGSISELTFDQVKRLDAGNWFGQNYSGERIPTLSEVFEVLGKNILINIELTNYRTPFDNLINIVADLVKQHNNMDQIFFSSFYPKNLIKIKKIIHNVPVALLAYPGILGFFQRSVIYRNLSPKIIHPYKKNINRTYIKKQHRINRRVHAWTVNDPQEIRQLLQNGVDGIITDNPKLARQLSSSI